MGMVSANLELPRMLEFSSALTYQSYLIDAAGEKVDFIFQAPKAGNLAKVGFLTRTVGTGDTLKISFQDVDLATGQGDGVDDEYRTLIVQSTDDNAWLTTGVITSTGADAGIKRSVDKGTLLCIRIAFNSFVAGNINIAGLNTGQTFGSPYSIWNGTKQVTSVPVFGLEYDDGSYEHVLGVYPFSALASTTINNGTTPDELGNKISIPFGARCSGLWMNGDFDGDFDVVLYDSADVLVASHSHDKDVRATTGNCYGYYMFATPATLIAGGMYRAVMKPTTATVTKVFYVDVVAAALMNALPFGSNIISTSRTDAGAWTDLNTQRYLMGLILDQIELGNMLVHPGMAGGMRG